MEFKVEKKAFKKILERVQGVAERHTSMPILSNVFIDARDNAINIMATDLEIFIKDQAEAVVSKDGKTTVNARKLFEIVKELPEGDIAVSLQKGDRLSIKAARSKFAIPTIDAKDFPIFPSIEEKSLTRIEPETLSEMIDKTIFAVSMDETRYNINGVYLEKDQSILRMVATDGHRLSIIEKENEGLPRQDKGVIVPRKGLGELKKLLEEKEGAYYLGITPKTVVLKKDNAFMNIRLIEGEFPDFKQVVPRDMDRSFSIGREQFLEALKRVSILSTDKIKGTKFNLLKNKLVISSSNPDTGDAVEELDVAYPDGEFEIAFNARYFIDALEALSDEAVVVELKDNLFPAKLRPQENQGYTYIIMPMKI